MAVTLTVGVVGNTDPLPPPVSPYTDLSVRITATATATGAAVAATGVTLTLSGPIDPETIVQADMTAGTTGVWTATVSLQGVGRYVVSASCSSPAAARSDDLPIIAMGSESSSSVPGQTAPATQEAQESAAIAEAAADRAEATVEAAVEGFRATPVIIDAPTAVTFNAHNNRPLYVVDGGSLSVSWADTGQGFSCHILNHSGATITLTFDGFDEAPVNVFSSAAIIDKGVAALMVVELPNASAREAWLSGDLTI